MLNKESFRIYLRSLEPEDFIKTVKWRHDEVYQHGVVSTIRFISSITEKNWIENAIKNHEQGKEIRLAVVLKENHEMIGMVYLTDINLINRTALMGSLLGIEENRGKGYITEARYLLFEYAFMQLNINRISATILENNVASRNSGEKFGYVREGLLRNAVYKDGEYHNLVAYSMLKHEFIEKYMVRGSH